MLNQYTLVGDDDDSPQMLETLSLNAAKVEYKHIEHNAKNVQGTPVAVAYDITQAALV